MDDMAHNLEELKKWIGQKETAVDYITIPAVHRLAATLDRAMADIRAIQAGARSGGCSPRAT